MASFKSKKHTPPNAASNAPDPLERWGRVGWFFLGLFAAAVALSRYLSAEVPLDFSAYLAAAQTFAAGENPYSAALFSAPNYQGFVYIYPPGTLPFLAPLTWAPAPVMAALESLLHLGALGLAMGWLRRRFELAAPLSICVGVAFLCYPFAYDYRVGNLGAYMLAALVGCAWMMEQPRQRAHHVAAAVLLGVGLAFKPMWGLSAGAILLARRRWAAAAGLLVGAALVALLSFVAWNGAPLLNDWWARLAELRAQRRSFSLLEWYAPLVVLVGLAWLGAALALLRRHRARNPELWLWACTLLLIWPRISSYSYLIFIPVIAYFWRRWGWQRALLIAVPMLEPTAWLFAALDAVHLQHQLLYAWAWGVALLLFVDLWRFEEPSGRPQPAQSRPLSAERAA